MKKIYIAPTTKAYGVHMTSMIAFSLDGNNSATGGGSGNTAGGDGDGEVKGEKGSGIWDLYN